MGAVPGRLAGAVQGSAGASGASRSLQGPPGASRGLQGPLGGSERPEAGCLGEYNDNVGTCFGLQGLAFRVQGYGCKL